MLELALVLNDEIEIGAKLVMKLLEELVISVATTSLVLLLPVFELLVNFEWL